MATAAEPDIDLEQLSDVEAAMDFTNSENFTETLHELFNKAYLCDPTSDHTILIKRFPIELLMVDDELSIIPLSSRVLYFQESQTLLLTMPGGPHETAAAELSDLMAVKITQMGCKDEVVNARSERVTIGGVTKEPDGSWGPFRAGTGHAYMTCVLESDASESTRALSRDAKIWLEHEESHVRQVITVKVYQQRPEIVFTIWKRAAQEQRDLRENCPLGAAIDQQKTVTLQAGRPVVEGVLCLSFEEIFERRPRLGTAEGDIEFSARELGVIARKVWSGMGFEIE
ncbi:hypothetical protein V493_06687 [Pseudogymnoascus sp. VKM F-4281 (FW-2241)]|nr:hypothetical protein V493_06687 [Pseudogymnoascus sp. VKM F-4281 (FW-2241)]